MSATPKHRELRIDTPSDREVVVTRVVSAPRELVFDVYTVPEHLMHWMLGPEGWTMPVCDIDLRPGGKFRYVWSKDDGSRMEISGAFREVVPPERLVSTESWGPEWPETINTVTFVEQDGETTITTRVLYPSKDIRDAALQTGMTDGMSVTFDRLDTYLAALA